MNSSQTYRLKPDDEFAFFTLAQLGECLNTLELSNSDVRPTCWLRARYYCHNEDCPVRDVDIAASWPDHDRPKEPVFECPSCREQLEFRTYLMSRLLIPSQ